MGKTFNRLTTAGCAIAFLALGGQQAFAMSAACAAINADWSAGVSFPGIVGANQELAPAYSEQFDAGETIYWTASSSGTPAANPAEAYFSIIENFPGLNQFALERNDVANFNVSGRYTFSGGESVQVILQADNRGAPQEGNAANARITCSDGSTAGVSQSISSFVATRQALLAATVDHPGLQERRLQQAGQISATPSGDGMLLQFAQSTAIATPAGDAVNSLARAQQGEPQRFNVWISGTARLHAQNASGVDHWGTFGLVSSGADYLITDSLLAGIAIHGDWLDDKTNAGTISGRGFLVGPYISAELAQGLYLDASALFGHTSNDVTSNGYTGRFDTRRMLLDAKLSGLVKLRDDITLIPNVKAFYLTETADGYTLADIGGTPIAMPGFTQDTLQLSAGGRVEFHLVSDSDVTWTPFISGDAGLGWTRGSTDPFLRLGTGVDLSFGNAWSLGAAVDATVTANGANSVGARAKLAVRF